MKFSLLSLFVRAHPRIPLVLSVLLFSMAVAGVLLRLSSVDTLGYPTSVDVIHPQPATGLTEMAPFPPTRVAAPDPQRNPFFSPFWKEWSLRRKSPEREDGTLEHKDLEPLAPVQDNMPLPEEVTSPEKTVPIVYRGRIRRPDGTPLAMLEFPLTQSHRLLKTGDHCYEFLLLDIMPNYLLFAFDDQQITLPRGQLVDFPVPDSHLPPEDDSPNLPDPASLVQDAVVTPGRDPELDSPNMKSLDVKSLDENSPEVAPDIPTPDILPELESDP